MDNLVALVLKTMPSNPHCNDFHHAKKDQHSPTEPCPVLTRWQETVKLLEQHRSPK